MTIGVRGRRAGVAVAMAAVIAGGGFAVGTATAGGEPAAASSTTAAASAGSGGTGTSGTGTGGTGTSGAGTSGTAAADVAPFSYADVVRRVLPSVVQIRTTAGLGSGVLLDQAGHIVTNAHVAGDATRFEVQLSGDPRPRTARLTGSYPAGDLAVIQVDDRSGLRPAPFGDSDRVRTGDVVLAVGNPLGLSSSVTEGIISATGRAVSEPASTGSPGTTLPGAIQTSAPINPGNSGGALVTTAGQVIGIPTLAAASPQSGAQAQGIGFAIPANTARDIAGQLISSGHVTSTHRGAIGAQVSTVAGADGQPAGAGIVAVSSGGPATRAGLQPGDVIQAFGREPTPDTSALAAALAGAHPGQTVTLTVARDARTLTVPVTLAELAGG